MHHGVPMGHGIGVGALGGGAGLTAFLLLLLAASILVVWWLWRRRAAAPPAEANRDAETRENLEGQILSMLTQAGGSLNQTQIQGNLGLPVQEVATALQRLEAEGQVSRSWQPEGYTYLVGVVA